MHMVKRTHTHSNIQITIYMIHDKIYIWLKKNFIYNWDVCSP